MRKTIAVATILLITLTSCAKPEPSKPVGEVPGSPIPPVQQNDPPVAHFPSIVDTWEVKRAEIVFVVDELGNTRGFLLDLNSTAELPIFGEASLYLEFDKFVKPETIQDIPRAQLINPQLLRILLDNATSSIVIPTTLTNINGTSLDREYNLSFRYDSETLLPTELLSCYPQRFPELKFEEATDLILNRGETFLLVQNWPFPRESFEKRVEEAFSTAGFAKEWLDDRTLAITIKQPASEYGWYELSLQGLEDAYGYKHEANCQYAFSLGYPKVIKSFHLSTGRETVQSIPMAVSGAASMNAKENVVELYRRHWGIHDPIHQHFTLDLSAGKVIGAVRTEHSIFPERKAAFDIVRPYLAPGEAYVYSALSPSGKIWATIYYNWSEDLSYLLLLDVTSGSNERFLLTSQHPYDGGSNPPPLPIWSPDETKLVYNALRDEGIYAFDMLTKSENKIVKENSYPLFYSPTGVLFFRTNGGYYMLSAQDTRTRLDIGNVTPRLVAWVDEDRALVSHDQWAKDGDCYTYSITANKLKFISKGTAFDYDPLTDTVFILDAAR